MAWRSFLSFFTLSSDKTSVKKLPPGWNLLVMQLRGSLESEPRQSACFGPYHRLPEEADLGASPRPCHGWSCGPRQRDDYGTLRALPTSHGGEGHCIGRHCTLWFKSERLELADSMSYAETIKLFKTVEGNTCACNAIGTANSQTHLDYFQVISNSHCVPPTLSKF